MIWNTNASLIETQLVPENAYFRQASEFMQSWLSGKEEFIFHTSGSTGLPKDIRVTRIQLQSSAFLTGKALNLPKGTRALVCLNINYIAGTMMLVRGLELGWDMTITEPSSNPLLEFEDPDFDFVAMVPFQLSTCLADEKTKHQVEHLGKILLGGAPIQVSLQKQIGRLNVAVFHSYGMTETVSHIALKRLNHPQPDNAYTVLPGIHFGVDHRGCIFLQGVVTGNEKVQTNDLVEITSENSFIWLGRADHVINSGGVKVVLDTVDQIVAEVFYESGYTNNFYSWHESDEKLGQKLILIIENNGDELSAEHIIKELRKRISVYQTPKHVYFVDEFIKTPTDKVDRQKTAQAVLG